MSGEKSGNENELTTEQIQGVLKEVNRRLQRVRQNLSCLLESLKKTAENLQRVHEGHAKLLEIERALETLSAKMADPPKGEKSGSGDSGKGPVRPAGPEGDGDPFYDAAAALFLSSGLAGGRFLTERLSIGFERSVKRIERMKAEGASDRIHITEISDPPRDRNLKPGREEE